MAAHPRLVAGLFFVSIAAARLAPAAESPAVTIETRDLGLQLDDRLWTRLVARGTGGETALGPFRASDYVVIGGRPVTDLRMKLTAQRTIRDGVGAGVQHELRGERAGLRQDLVITAYTDFPGLLLVQSHYTNTGPREVTIDRWVSQRFLAAATSSPPFWSYQTGSYSSRPDWVLPLRPGFAQANFQGMNASDYGGGTPIADVWRRDVGVAVGHVELAPRLVSLPVAMPDARGATVGIEEKIARTLRAGERFSTPLTFVAVHRGDHFAPLADYRRLMIARGVSFPPFGSAAYQPIWCGWGYERGVTLAQMRGTLAKAAALGFGTAVLDDGWQTAIGDWTPAPAKFPRAGADLAALTTDMRTRGLLPMLWWTPLAAVADSQLLREHPDYRLLDRKGKPQRISWWNAELLCPAYAPVRAHTEALVTTFAGWGFTAQKLDGQHLNGVPPCFNPQHDHARPEESVEALPTYLQLITDTARKHAPDPVVELCPCGTSYAFHSLPATNLPAASDPESSWQIRSKGKTLKALLGPDAPYFGDHVELSDRGDDFASTVGVGGVVGSQFTLPELPPSPRKYQLTPAKEHHFRKWVDLYRQFMLSRGQYRGDLYDVGFDRPEAHAIAKEGRMYYAFFTEGKQRRFRGEVELRGLRSGTYRVRDYVAQREHGRVTGPSARLRVSFDRHLLLEATPE